jgi:hypothetical protein
VSALAMGARTIAAPIAAAPNAGAMNLTDVFMILPPILLGCHISAMPKSWRYCRLMSPLLTPNWPYG